LNTFPCQFKTFPLKKMLERFKPSPKKHQFSTFTLMMKMFSFCWELPPSVDNPFSWKRFPSVENIPPLVAKYTRILGLLEVDLDGLLEHPSHLRKPGNTLPTDVPVLNILGEAMSQFWKKSGQIRRSHVQVF
jgi:hypothetical protein